MGIRQALPHDGAQLAQIYNHYITETAITFETEEVDAEEMTGRIRSISEEGPYLVYELNNQIVGYAYCHKWKARAAYSLSYETTVYVRPGFERQGIGSSLMERLIEDCRAQGIHALIACITHPNEPSERLHEKLGFTRVSLFREVGRKGGSWLDVQDMELLLR